MIVVPDDFPSVFEGTPAHERAKKLGDVSVFTERGADAEQELIVVTRRGARYEERRVLPVRFVPMTGKVRQ